MFIFKKLHKMNRTFFFLRIFVLCFLIVSIACSKTDDVEPISNNSGSGSGSGGSAGTGGSGGSGGAGGTGTTDTIFYGFLLNEVLYDPPSGSIGDANGDGTRDPNEDEFVEFVNDSDSIVDLSGYKIFDEENLSISVPNHVFYPNTILNPGDVIVVFGGGDSLSMDWNAFGGAQVQLSSNVVMNLNNGNDIFTLTDPNDNVVITFDITVLSGNPDESYTRYPDLEGVDFVQHNADTPSGLLYSPGTKIDGTNF